MYISCQGSALHIPESECDSCEQYLDELDKKQDKLIDGENIKTINGESLLGPGNIDIEGGDIEYATPEEVSNILDNTTQGYGSLKVLTLSVLSTIRDWVISLIPARLSDLLFDVGDGLSFEDNTLSAQMTSANTYTKSEVNAIADAKAPTDHASTETTYGVGNSTNYGHLKLSASTASTSGVSGGIAATPSAVKSVKDSLVSWSTSNLKLVSYTVKDNLSLEHGVAQPVTWNSTSVPTTTSDGYTILSRVPFQISVINATDDGSGSTYAVPSNIFSTGCHVRNVHASASAKVKVVCYFLYQKTHV